MGPNDATSDGNGGAYLTASGPWESGPIVGKVYHLAASGALTPVADDLHYANGIQLSADGKAALTSPRPGASSPSRCRRTAAWPIGGCWSG